MTHFLHYFTIRVTSNVGGLCRRLGWQRTEHTRVLPAPEPRVSEEPLSPAPDTSPLLSGQGATGHSVTVSGYCYTISCHQPHQQQQSGDQFTVKAQVLSSSGDPPTCVHTPPLTIICWWVSVFFMWIHILIEFLYTDTLFMSLLFTLLHHEMISCNFVIRNDVNLIDSS